eukprot:CAMPEP_0194268748 /NCGR_PEP_ID=MMETSP0169-20130528/3013_1 /TAXON_ID=218684 /ORGANISM="Corethron pennatum, Strain L29A3" /LENGTH=298 /DNA_ID=CAMNT_0039010101 /DNA_START=38 /DNA_END=934 /DNA_ORIENTATION=-
MTTFGFFIIPVITAFSGSISLIAAFSDDRSGCYRFPSSSAVFSRRCGSADNPRGGGDDFFFFKHKHVVTEFDRRTAVSHGLTFSLASAATCLLPPIAGAAEEKKEGAKVKEVLEYKTPSGLRYRELITGKGLSPSYGQIVSFSYIGYVRVGTGTEKGKPVRFDENKDGYLAIHGSGRIVPGLDEGLHTMKVGGRRRIIISPKLGYAAGNSGTLGPIPEWSFARNKLNKLLDAMVEARGGELIFDVDLLRVVDNEADQGYYDDTVVSEEEFEKLRRNFGGAIGGIVSNEQDDVPNTGQT